MTRGAPSQMSRLQVPRRDLRAAQTVTCPTCRSLVPTRDGRIAGHYALATELCTSSSKTVPTDPTRGEA